MNIIQIENEIESLIRLGIKVDNNLDVFVHIFSGKNTVLVKIFGEKSFEISLDRSLLNENGVERFANMVVAAWTFS